MAPRLPTFNSCNSDISGSSQHGTASVVSEDDDDLRKAAAIDAACLGRLSRLPEYIIESVAPSEEVRNQEKKWRVKRAAQTAILRSSFRRCVQEAASVGLIKRQEPINSFHGEVKAERRDDGDNKSMQVEESLNLCSLPLRSSPQGRTRKAHSVDTHVSTTRKEKNKSWASPLARLEFMELEMERESQWAHRSLSTLDQLPSPKPPKFKRQRPTVGADKLRECLAVQAADVAFERTWRLVNEPHKEFRITRQCTCIYCSIQPSPLQTQEYQRLQSDPFYSPPPVRSPLEDDGGICQNTKNQEMNVEEKLPSSHPTLESIYGRPVVFLSQEELKEEFGRAVMGVAMRAVDRSVRLQRKGEGYRIRKRCACIFCRTASVQQTQSYLQQKEAVQKDEALNKATRTHEDCEVSSSKYFMAFSPPHARHRCTNGGILDVSHNLSPSQVVSKRLLSSSRRQKPSTLLSLRPPLFYSRQSEGEPSTPCLSWLSSATKLCKQEERDDAETSVNIMKRPSSALGVPVTRIESDPTKVPVKDRLIKNRSPLDGDVDEEESLRLEIYHQIAST